MSNLFKDFIPAHEDPGAVGDGFKDFVPPLQPKPIVPEVTPVKVEAKEVKGKK